MIDEDERLATEDEQQAIAESAQADEPLPEQDSENDSGEIVVSIGDEADGQHDGALGWARQRECRLSQVVEKTSHGGGCQVIFIASHVHRFSELKGT